MYLQGTGADFCCPITSGHELSCGIQPWSQPLANIPSMAVCDFEIDSRSRNKASDQLDFITRQKATRPVHNARVRYYSATL